MSGIREQSANVIANALRQQHGHEPSSLSTGTDVEAIATRIEQAVFEANHGETGNAYRNAMRTLSLDLGKNNVDLARQLVQGTLTPAELISLGPEGLKTDKRAHADQALREQGLRDAIGQQKIPVAAGGGIQQGPAASANLADAGEVGIHEASMGEEGDFKARAQPKIQGLEGIEFESGL